MTERDYGRPADDTERQSIHRILHQCFVAGDTIDSVERWMRVAEPENLRVIREGGRVVGGLVTIPMGIFLGGESVPTTGIAGVGVDPAVRGRGVARDLMRFACRELRERTPLTSLYASNYELYRSVGYERAGGRFRATVATRDLPREKSDAVRGLAVRPMAPEDDPAMRALYTECARRHSGAMDRGPYLWKRVASPRDVKVVHSWLVHDGNELVGYARWHQPPSSGREGGDGSFYDLEVVDMAARDARAIRRIFALFADHSSLGGHVRWWSGPDDPFLLALGDRYYSLELSDLWMVRILDVERALSARGYPAAVSGELHLEIEDDVLPEVAGAWTVRAEGGRVRVTRGGEGRIRTTARGLASLYSGYLPTASLETLGWLEGPEDELALAGALFTGPVPWCPDMY